MKKLTGIILGVAGVLLVGSLAFGWCPMYHAYAPGYNTYVAPQAHATNVNVDAIKKQISEKQAELSVIFAQKNPDTQKIARLQNELKDLYNALNSANVATNGYGVAPYPYYGCPWGWGPYGY